jgi:hypothetical protein
MKWLIALGILLTGFAGCAPATAAEFGYMINPPSVVSVMAEGVGATRDEAIAKSLVAAANQAVGVLIIGTQQIKNDSLVTKEVFQQTAGIVNKYEVVLCTQESSYWCQIKAQVSTKPLIAVMQSHGGKSTEVDGESEYAKQFMYRTNLKNSADLLAKAMYDANSTGLTAKLKTTALIPTAKDYAKLQVKMKLGLDTAYYDYLNEIAKRASEVVGSERTVTFEIPYGESKIHSHTVKNQLLGIPGSMVLINVHLLGDNDKDLAQECVSTSGMYGVSIVIGQGYLVRFKPERDFEFNLDVPERVLKDMREIKVSLGCSSDLARKRKAFV